MKPYVARNTGGDPDAEWKFTKPLSVQQMDVFGCNLNLDNW
jgi:hypothetical protein